jgi:signal transduction histidine kinase
MGMTDREDRFLQRRWQLWGLLLGLWTLVGLCEAGQYYLQCRFLDRHAPVDLLVCLALTEWYLFGLLSPLLIQMQQATAVLGWKWALPLQAVGLALFALAQVALDVPVNRIMAEGWPRDWTALQWFQGLLAARYSLYLLVGVLILGGCHVRDYYRKYRERELRASQLQAHLAQAELQVLKMQLHPHFLFNTLHTIAALVRVDVDLAERMIARLGDLLRSSLESAGQQEVPLRQELEFVQPYLEIEQARLGPRLRVRLDIAPDVRDAWVPNLVLQPLIENAIRHGIAARAEGGTISVRAWRGGGQLHLEVADDGPGLAKPPAHVGHGIGLANTRARLAQLYGDAHRFELRSMAGQGLVVALSLPFRDEADDGPIFPPEIGVAPLAAARS